MKKIFIVAFTLFITIGCATTNYAQQASRLSLGMKKQEVINILGVAKKSSMRKHEGEIIEKLSYWTAKTIGFTTFDNEMMASDAVSVTLTDGIVTEWGNSMDISRVMEKSMEQQAKIMKNMRPAEVKVILEK